MADVLALLIVALMVLAGLGALSLITRAKRRIDAARQHDAPRRLQEDLRDTDEYIEQVRNALSQEDLDSIDDKRRQEP